MELIKYELMHLCDSAYLLAAFNITMNYCFRMANIILPVASSFSSSMKNNTDGLPQDIMCTMHLVAMFAFPLFGFQKCVIQKC